MNPPCIVDQTTSPLGQEDSHLHLIVETIVKNEVMSHSDAVRFHRMTWPIVVTAQLWVVEIRNLQGPQD